MSANTLLTSVVTGGTNSHATVVEEANATATDFISNGVVGTFGVNLGSGGTGSFCVNADASPDMGVTIKAGQAYVTATPSGQNSQTLRVRAAADYTAYTINSNSSGSTKYDWIYLTISATNANNPAADASNVASFTTSRSSSNTTDNGSPPTYGYLLAIVTVANAASSITNANILDKRVQASVSTAGTSNTTGWITGLTVPSTVAYNGNRSYTLTFNGTDLTGTVSPGMRLRTTRLVAAPTQCTSLNGTTQYYSKISPAGMTFTDSFTTMAWIKLANYTASADMAIESRYNGTSGWIFNLTNNGQIKIQGIGTASAVDFALSSQSVPLNKWVHVAATLSMATTTANIYIDGVLVPSTYTNGAASALIQAGNYEIGSYNGGTNPFSGKIAQASVFNAVLSQATILASMNQGLSGTEASEVSAYSFNNSINDLNANANNLTANGSAVATNADSPFGGQADGSINSTLDYAEIVTSSFSTNTTLVVRCSDVNTIPTSGGVSAMSYSTQATPYQMPIIGSVLGQSFLAAIQTTQSTSYTDVPGLTSTVYVPPNRKIKITFKSGEYIAVNGTTVNTTVGAAEDGTVFEDMLTTSPSSGFAVNQSYSVVRMPATSGVHTYKMQWKTNNGAQVTTLNAIATAQAYILIEVI